MDEPIVRVADVMQRSLHMVSGLASVRDALETGVGRAEGPGLEPSVSFCFVSVLFSNAAVFCFGSPSNKESKHN